MRCTKSLRSGRLQKMQEYWWYVEAFCKRPERKDLVQIAGENRSIWVLTTVDGFESRTGGGGNPTSCGVCMRYTQDVVVCVGVHGPRSQAALKAPKFFTSKPLTAVSEALIIGWPEVVRKG